LSVLLIHAPAVVQKVELNGRPSAMVDRSNYHRESRVPITAAQMSAELAPTLAAAL